MFSKDKNIYLYASIAAAFFAAGWACNKIGGNSSGISPSEVVATVDGNNITFGDWMEHVDLTRVLFTPIDPSNPDEVKLVLKNLIDQQLVLEAAKKDNFSDPKFSELLTRRMAEADLNIKEQKEKLEKDLQAVERIEKNYKESLKRMLLASQYAKSKMDGVSVTDKDLRAWYAEYSIQARQAGQTLPPYEKVKDRIKGQVGPEIQRDKFVGQLEEAAKIHRNEDIIKKYTDTLSSTQDIFDAKDKAPSAGAAKTAGNP